ncbi:hypothetical protein AVEN_159453-1 [Araneus ventricosus]|uniref:Uncharacterized protein n=1 Tax=Araneus ventricosus TaxID=182803 RepID=A0A4Y2A231_ARAVE|nr:hypothetical protein AVEN_159453-1 [Araneus ventricosus]
MNNSVFTVTPYMEFLLKSIIWKESDSIIHSNACQTEYKRELFPRRTEEDTAEQISSEVQRTQTTWSKREKEKTRNERNRCHGNCILPSARHQFILNLFSVLWFFIHDRKLPWR